LRPHTCGFNDGNGNNNKNNKRNNNNDNNAISTAPIKSKDTEALGGAWLSLTKLMCF